MQYADTVSDDRGQWIETARAWTLHLMCFVLPLTTLAFVASGPHSRWVHRSSSFHWWRR